MQKKKTILSIMLVYMLLLCSGCSNTDSIQTNAQSSSGNNATSSTASEDNDNISELDFDTYNVLSAEPVGDMTGPNNIGFYEQEISVTNNSSEIVSNISITVCYYDESGNILDNRSWTPSVSLKANQSINITSSYEKEYISCEVTNYSYSTSHKIAGEYDGVNVDTIAETITGYYVP